MEEVNKQTKMAVISGAAHALRYKDEHPRALEQEIMQHITDTAEEILSKIDMKSFSKL